MLSNALCILYLIKTKQCSVSKVKTFSYNAVMSFFSNRHSEKQIHFILQLLSGKIQIQLYSYCDFSLFLFFKNGHYMYIT